MKHLQKFRLSALLATELAMVGMECLAISASWSDMGKRMFRYYTQDSNILAMIVCAISAVFTLVALLAGREHRPKWVMILKHMATSCLMITFLVAAFVLTPAESSGTWLSFRREFHSMMLSGELLYLHTLCPLVMFFSFLLLEDNRRLTVRATLATIIPTLIYGISTLYMNITRAYVGPYFFFQIHRQPACVTALWCAGVLLAAFFISWAIAMLSHVGRNAGNARGAAPRPRQET